MAHTHCAGPRLGQGQGPENDGFLYITMYCTHYTGAVTGTGNHCFLLCRSCSLFQSPSRSRARAIRVSQEIPQQRLFNNQFLCGKKERKLIFSLKNTKYFWKQIYFTLQFNSLNNQNSILMNHNHISVMWPLCRICKPGLPLDLCGIPDEINEFFYLWLQICQVSI